MQLQDSSWPDGQILDIIHGQRVCVVVCFEAGQPIGQLRALMPAGRTKHLTAAGQIILACNHCQPQQCVSHTEVVYPVLARCELEYAKSSS